MFRYCETKQFRQKIVLLPPSPVSRNSFRNQKFSEAQKGCSTKNFGTVRQKLIDGNRDAPPPLSYP